MATKISFNFKEFEDLMYSLDDMQKDVKQAVEGAMKATKAYITPKAGKAMGEYKRTGKTEKSLDRDMSVTWEGEVASIYIGFKIRKGGLPSIFFMYGTPRHAPRNQYGSPKKSNPKMIAGIQKDKELYDAFYGARTKREIKKLQKEALEKVLKRG